MSIVVEPEQFQELAEDEVLEDFSQEATSEEVLDDLESSIEDLPTKFQDKSKEDIAKSYLELEREMGRKNNEVGELRKLTDDFLKQQLDTPTQETGSKVDLDELLENPNDVINKAVDDNPRIAALEKQLQQARIVEQKTGFESKHSDWQDVLNSGDFQNWIKDSPVRQTMYKQADSQYDYAMADELLNLYKDVRGAAKEVAEGKADTKRKKALRQTATSKGGTGEVSKKVFKRADLIRLKQSQPSRYDEPSFQEELLLAYQEGRVR